MNLNPMTLIRRRAYRAQEQEAMAVQAAQPIAGAMKDAAQANQLLQGA